MANTNRKLTAIMKSLIYQKPLNNFAYNFMSSSDKKQSQYVRLEWMVLLNKVVGFCYEDMSVGVNENNC